MPEDDVSVLVVVETLVSCCNDASLACASDVGWNACVTLITSLSVEVVGVVTDVSTERLDAAFAKTCSGVSGSTELICCFAGQNTMLIVGDKSTTSLLGTTPMIGRILAPKPP